MNLSIENIKNTTVITLNEERLDAHNSASLKTAVQKLYEDGTRELLINLGTVRFIDSSGLGALVSGFKNATASMGSLKRCSLQPQVKSMFELTRLHRVFEIFTTVEEALG
jgi:anti-sigma B factor antagonist